MQIDYLSSHRRHIPLLAGWFHQQWSHLNPQRTLDQRVERLQTQAADDRFPVTLVAVEGDQVLGSASLVEYDLAARTDLSPWLASVFVAPPQRRKGIGAALVRRIVEEARRFEFPDLYLFTTDREQFYQDLGWTTQERTRTLDGKHAIVIMSMKLDR